MEDEEEIEIDVDPAREIALERACELACNTEGGNTPENIVAVAKLFEAYLRGD